MAETPNPPAEEQSGGPWVDPYAAYNFGIDIRGVNEGRFTEVSGLSVRVVAHRYREAGQNQIVHRLPGPVEYGDVLLRYGVSKSEELWQWMQRTIEGRVERRNVSIILYKSDASTEAMRWDLQDAWPSEWRAAPLDSLGREIAIDSLVIVYEQIRRRGASAPGGGA